MRRVVARSHWTRQDANHGVQGWGWGCLEKHLIDQHQMRSETSSEVGHVSGSCHMGGQSHHCRREHPRSWLLSSSRLP